MLRKKFFQNSKKIPYKNVKSLITCEEYLEYQEGNLFDYKYFCFNGKAEFIRVVSDREIEAKSNFYNLEWNYIPLRTKLKNSSKQFTRPINLEKMNELANILSKEYPFVRVDFYNINGRIIFGELTFTPGGGVSKFRPLDMDYKIAQKIDLSKYNNGHK